MPSSLQNTAILSLIKINPIDFSDPNHDHFYYFYNHPANNTWMYYSTRSKKDFYKVCETFFAQMNAIYLLQEETNGVKKIIGACSVKQFPPPRQHVIELTSGSIDPESHRKSYGKKFFVLLKAHLKIDFPEAFRYELSYGRNNPVAYTHRFYEKNGVEDEAVWHDFFRSDAPCYDGKENLYTAWLTENGGDLKRLKNCWYADEIVAAYFTMPKETIKNYQPQQKGWQSNITIPDFLAAKNKDFTAREATKADLDACVNLYFLSNTTWGFLDKTTLKQPLHHAIDQKNLWLVQTSNNIVGACTIVLAPAGLTHSASLMHPVVQHKDVTASFFLFQQVVNFIKNTYPEIKRIEMNVMDDDLFLASGLMANDFQYTGTLACRLQTHDQTFFDEHVFEKSLFQIEDAVILCQNRLQSELFFKENPKIAYPFSLPLTTDYLETVLKKLGRIQQTHKSLTFAEENHLYQMIKIICTQDAIPPAERLAAMQRLEKW